MCCLGCPIRREKPAKRHIRPIEGKGEGESGAEGEELSRAGAGTGKKSVESDFSEGGLRVMERYARHPVKEIFR